VETAKRDVFVPSSSYVVRSCDALLGDIRQRPAEQRLKLQSTDTLRLDVAFSPSGREIYSWAGASKFEDGELDELVQEGAMGTGAYAAMLLSAFENRGTKYAFEGATATGRRLYEYSFSVSVEQSRYRVKARKDWIITGYTGTILVDPKTSDLVRLTVRTEELPPETNTCQTTTSLEYGLVQLSGSDYLLPTMASQRFIGRDAYEAENTMSFSACRDFHAESTLDFGDKSAAAAKLPAPPPGAGGLPQGLPVTVELIQAIPFAAAAAGDRIEGRLAAPVRGLGGTTLLPAGALVQGRLMRVETRYSPHVERTIVLRWETVEIGGTQLPVSLVPNRATPKEVPITARGSVLRKRATVFELPRTSEVRYASFSLPDDVADLAAGFRSEWITVKP
jgi:hypothetical protein